MTTADAAHPDDPGTLKAALAATRSALEAAEAQVAGAEAMIAHLRLRIAKLERDKFGQTSERGRNLLDQLELQLEELEATATEDEAAAAAKAGHETMAVRSFERKKPVRAPLPAHLPRERVVIPAACSCPECGGKLAKLGEDITETLEVSYGASFLFIGISLCWFQDLCPRRCLQVRDQHRIGIDI